MSFIRREINAALSTFTYPSPSPHLTLLVTGLCLLQSVDINTLSQAADCIDILQWVVSPLIMKAHILTTKLLTETLLTTSDTMSTLKRPCKPTFISKIPSEKLPMKSSFSSLKIILILS